jgi:hypothetical protein
VGFCEIFQCEKGFHERKSLKSTALMNLTDEFTRHINSCELNVNYCQNGYTSIVSILLLLNSYSKSKGTGNKNLITQR